MVLISLLICAIVVQFSHKNRLKYNTRCTYTLLTTAHLSVVNPGEFWVGLMMIAYTIHVITKLQQQSKIIEEYDEVICVIWNL